MCELKIKCHNSNFHKNPSTRLVMWSMRQMEAAALLTSLWPDQFLSKRWQKNTSEKRTERLWITCCDLLLHCCRKEMDLLGPVQETNTTALELGGAISIKTLRMQHLYEEHTINVTFSRGYQGQIYKVCDWHQPAIKIMAIHTGVPRDHFLILQSVEVKVGHFRTLQSEAGDTFKRLSEAKVSIIFSRLVMDTLWPFVYTNWPNLTGVQKLRFTRSGPWTGAKENLIYLPNFNPRCCTFCLSQKIW